MSPISESLLSSWAAPPGDAQAQEAYKQVRTALGRSTDLTNKTVDIYLQGSYRNRTHIRADSDVDVVTELQSTFYYDISSLSTNEKSLFEKRFPGSATYGYDELRQDTLNALVSYFGAGDVTEGNKCFKIKGNSSRSDADVLVCLEHRKYTSFTGRNGNKVSGIKFRTRKGIWVINWPKVHYSNGAGKNDVTDGKFKETVRIFKNIRNFLIDQNLVGENNAPSYFLECLLYNVPNSYFGTTYTVCLEGALRYLKSTTLDNFVCVNEQVYLFKGSNGWNKQDAQNLLTHVEAVHQVAKS